MKVDAPASLAAAAAARRAASAVAPGFVVPMEAAPRPTQTAPAAQAASLTQMGALLALQGADEPGERRRRATRRAGDLLDQLEDLRMATLGGGVTRAQVARLAVALREQRDAVDDPELTALLDDVELRAEVELAKLQRAL